MNDPRDVIHAPVISEKTYGLLDDNKYTFVVNKRANKVEIAQAVEKLFDVKVRGVNTMNRNGKVKRRGLILGKRKDTKKAIVTLEGGDTIDLFTI